MKTLLTFILTLFLGLSYGQSFSYPAISSKGHRLNDFVPFGWTILDSAKGDLNQDGRKDAVIILQHDDSVRLIKSEDTILTQPRILVILFKNTSDSSFHLSEQSNSFILTHDDPFMDDPYQEMTIDKGVLKLNFHTFFTSGSWYTTSGTYKFRYDGKEFILIGAELFTIHRATLDYENYSYNFLTNKRNYTKGNDQKATKRTTVKNVTISKPMTFNNFSQPFSWEVEKDISL